MRCWTKPPAALDAVHEAALYRQLEGLAITPVSISHHPGCGPYHRWVLELQGDGQGGWRLWPRRTTSSRPRTGGHQAWGARCR
jgi:ABC-type uncharacterized transport system fused permease/ATPase subunit